MGSSGDVKDRNKLSINIFTEDLFDAETDFGFWELGLS